MTIADLIDDLLNDRMPQYNITFQGERYVLLGKSEGAICKPGQFRHGHCSYAYLTQRGDVMRFNEKIGTKEDIVFLGKRKRRLEPADDAWDGMEGDSWEGGQS